MSRNDQTGSQGSLRSRCLAAIGMVAAILGLVGCEVDVSLNPKSAPAKTGKASSATKLNTSGTQFVRSSTPVPARSAETIRIASFNIQVLGQSKIRKPEVADALVKIVRQFDIVAVQELRSKQQDVIPKFLQILNADGARYASVVGPRLGRSSSKEQYVYLYDETIIESVPNSTFTTPDQQDHLHREPLVSQFRVRQAGGRGFSFSLINIHTDPDETDQELDALDDVFQFVQQHVSPEDDVILLGDLNVSPRKLGQLGRVPGITWTVRNQMTNTLRTKSYDNILFHQRRTAEYTGRSGVLDFQRALGLTKEEALRVSDHMPVWAEFTAREAGPVTVAGRPDRNRK